MKENRRGGLMKLNQVIVAKLSYFFASLFMSHLLCLVANSKDSDYDVNHTTEIFFA